MNMVIRTTLKLQKVVTLTLTMDNIIRTVKVQNIPGFSVPHKDGVYAIYLPYYTSVSGFVQKLNSLADT